MLLFQHCTQNTKRIRANEMYTSEFCWRVVVNFAGHFALCRARSRCLHAARTGEEGAILRSSRALRYHILIYNLKRLHYKVTYTVHKAT